MKVSVIVAAHNAAETLQETLESLYHQTHTDWEAIVIDDGSTDATLMLAERFAARDRRFQILSQANAGVSAARNAGIKLARHEWLLFLDADDWILPQHLERMTQVLAADDSLDAVYCNWAYVTPDGYQVFEEIAADRGDLFPLHAEGCPFAIHAYVVRRELVEAVGGFDPELRVCEDWDLWQRIARTGAHFGALPQMLAPYRMRASSASMDGHRILTDGLRVLQQGHAPDSRMPRPHPAYPEGLPADQLAQREFYLLCSAAGLVIGRNEDARTLLNAFKHTDYTKLEPYTVADCIVQSAMLSAGHPLCQWHIAWHQLEYRANEFLQALEVHSGNRYLARRVRPISRRLIFKHMVSLGPLHRIRAFQARLLLLPSKLRSGFGPRAQTLTWRCKQLSRNSLRMMPTLYRYFRLLRRRYGTGEDRDFFEDLFAEQADPWGYTTAYEQVKYEQTLHLIPEDPIEEALELACAEGHFTVQLAPRVGRLMAADISQVALDRTAKRCKDFSNVHYQRIDLAKDPIPGRFDLIVCSEVLYFTRDRKRLRAVARKLFKALKPGGSLVMAHGNVIIDEPDHPGFNWGHAFGAKGIGETFAEIPALRFTKELRTPLYRIQLFRRDTASELSAGRRTPEIVEMEQPTPLKPEVASQVLWNGSTDRLPILMYHRVAPTGSAALSPWRVTPTAFEEHLRYLRDAGFQSVRLEDWRAWVDHGEPLPRGAILITFDDGYRDFKEYAWPLLQRYGFSATVYLVADEIGRTNRWDHEHGEVIPLLGWREIRTLQAEGVVFGSHSATHRPLPALPLKEVIRELARSYDILAQGLGTHIQSFAYPYGEFNRVIQFLTGACGYDFGLSCRPGLCTANDSLLALPRIEVEGSDTLETFVAKFDASQVVD